MADLKVFEVLNPDECALCGQGANSRVIGMYVGSVAAVRYFTCASCRATLTGPEGDAARQKLLVYHRERAEQCIRDGVMPKFSSVKEALCIK